MERKFPALSSALTPIRRWTGPLVGALAVSATAFCPEANAQSVVNLCAGPSVSLPVLNPVTTAVDNSAIAGILNPLLSGLVGNINVNLTNALSGQPLSVSLLDQNGNLISVPSANCAVSIANPGGISLGGGQISGLGGNGNIPSVAGDPSAIAIGNGAVATPAGSLALGTGASATAAGGVALGSGSIATRLNSAAELFTGAGLRPTIGTVSVGSAGNERQIVNVAGGTQDTDAVNLRQLRSVGTNLATSLGGGSNFSLATGAFTAPSYVIGGTTYRDVGSAINAIGAAAPASSLVAQAAPGAPITVGVATDGTLVSIRGTVGDRVLTGVAPGAVALGSTDAINGSQLAQRDASLASTVSLFGGGATYNPLTGAVGTPTFTLGGRTYTDVASAFASIAVGPVLPAGLVQQATPTAPITVGVATGGTSVDFTGQDGTRTLTGVTAGRLAANSTDAVNGGQLFGTNQRLDTLAANAVQYDVVQGTGQKGNSVTLAGGDPGAPVLLRNVAAGLLASDGANVGQVRAAQQASFAYTDTRAAQTLTQANAYTDQQISRALGSQSTAIDALGQEVRAARKEARQAAAVGLAAGSLRYDDRPGKISLAAGGGAWRGESGAAFGLGYTSPDGFARFNAAASTTGTDWGVSGGMSLTLN